MGTGCRLSQLLFFPTSSSLVSIIYTSKKLTLFNEIALEIAFGAWDVALPKLAGLLLLHRDCLWALEKKSIELGRAQSHFCVLCSHK